MSDRSETWPPQQERRPSPASGGSGAGSGAGAGAGTGSGASTGSGAGSGAGTGSGSGAGTGSGAGAGENREAEGPVLQLESARWQPSEGAWTAPPHDRAPPDPELQAVEAALALPKERPHLSDITATLAERWVGCWRYARLALEYPRSAGREAGIGDVAHKVLEIAGRLRLHKTVTKPRADLRELKKILDELLAQGHVLEEDYDDVAAVLANFSPVDYAQLAAVEQPFDLVLDKFTRAGGTIDRIDEVRTGQRLVAVDYHDYKSGAAKTVDQLRRHPQTLLYLIAGREAYPDPAVRLVLHYQFMRFGEEVTIEWTDELDAWGRTYLVRLVDLWYSGKSTANTGKRCGACELSAACEEGTAWLKRQTRRDQAFADWLDPAKLALEYREVKEAVDGLKKYRGRLGRALMEQIPEGKKELPAGAYVARMKSRRKTSYSPAAVPEVQRALAAERAAANQTDRILTLDALVRKACKVSTGKLRELVADAPQAKARLEHFLELDRSTWVEVVPAKQKIGGES